MGQHNTFSVESVSHLRVGSGLPSSTVLSCLARASAWAGLFASIIRHGEGRNVVSVPALFAVPLLGGAWAFPLSARRLPLWTL